MHPLPSVFIDAPLAHRALHGPAGRPENSRAAICAAIKAGYGVEIDLQLSADGQAMVFHDYALDRLTGHWGAVRQKTAAELKEINLLGSDEGIPTLAEILNLVGGQAPLLIELKDQDGAMGPNVGPLEEATVAQLNGYSGPVAVMSFNPHSVATLADLAPRIPRGLVTSAFCGKRWPLLPAMVRDRLRDIPDADRVGTSFLSHDVDDLTRPRVRELKNQGLPILCWTVRSAEQEREARQIADNITFEGYMAAHPG